MSSAYSQVVSSIAQRNSQAQHQQQGDKSSPFDLFWLLLLSRQPPALETPGPLASTRCVKMSRVLTAGVGIGLGRVNERERKKKPVGRVDNLRKIPTGSKRRDPRQIGPGLKTSFQVFLFQWRLSRFLIIIRVGRVVFLVLFFFPPIELSVVCDSSLIK
jgi:hypothetical protein